MRSGASFLTIRAALVLVLVILGLQTIAPAPLKAALLDRCNGGARQISVLAWPNTDFSRCTVLLDEIFAGGPGKDGIPAIDDVRIREVEMEKGLTADEPVISLSLNGDARAWPLRYLIWHEIANDTLGGIPIAVTYCPLCNAAIVFDRRHQDVVLDFGTTGNLRHSDLVMYDRQTESWWQQYTGEAIIGHYAGDTLTVLASRLESWGNSAPVTRRARCLFPATRGNAPTGPTPIAAMIQAASRFSIAVRCRQISPPSPGWWW